MIKKIREMRKMTQEEVAKQMGISQNAYSKIENNITQLNVNHIRQISMALNVSPLDLLKDDFEIHKPLSLQAQSITREVLVMHLDQLKEMLHSKLFDKHELYPLFMYQLQAAENILTHID
ncbi:MAG: helix-turn-helix transcriptional regulator [Chitinophagaceae bacterium]